MAVYAIAMQGVSLGWLLGGISLDVLGNFETILLVVAGSMTVILLPVLLSRDIRRV